MNKQKSKIFFISFCAFLLVINTTHSQINRLPQSQHKIIIEKSNQLVYLVENLCASDKILVESGWKKLSPFEKDTEKLSFLKIMDDFKPNPEEFRPVISLERYLKKIEEWNKNITINFNNEIKYNRLPIEIKNDFEEHENKVSEGTIFYNKNEDNPNKKRKYKIHPVFKNKPLSEKKGYLISTYIKRNLNTEQGSRTIDRSEYINIVWFVKLSKKNGFNDITTNDYKLVGYGYVNDKSEFAGTKNISRASLTLKQKKQAETQAKELVENYLKDHNDFSKGGTTVQDSLIKYFQNKNTKIKHHVPAEKIDLVSTPANYLSAIKNNSYASYLGDTKNIELNENPASLGSPFVVVRTKDSLRYKGQVCVTERNITVKFDYKAGKLSNPKISSIDWKQGRESNVKCSDIPPPIVERLTKALPTKETPENNPATLHRLAEQAVESAAKEKFEKFLINVQNKLAGEQVNTENLKSFFQNDASNIEVTNHIKKGSDIFYGIESYFNHLNLVEKEYSNIQFTFKVGKVQALDLSQGKFQGRIYFTQKFKGVGRKDYCDITRKFVRVHLSEIKKNGQIVGYKTQFGEIVANKTEPCNESIAP